MLDQNAISLAMLVSIPGIGQRTASHILRVLTEKRLTWQEFWVEKEKIWKDLNCTEKQENGIKNWISEHTIDGYIDELSKKKIRVITENSAEYPPLLKEIDQPPVVLFVQGKELNWKSAGPPIAIVGTRHITSYGKQVTQKITQELVWSRVQIVSGFMYGVDVCAHLTALENHGETIGILGFGFDHMYPSSQKKLYQECLKKGMTFISPFSPDVRPTAGNFPARNVIVAGMSAAVVVIEATEKSGTHITAGYAVDFGRSVCAVPGSIFSPYSTGTKWLVNQGAALVASGEEVMEELGERTQLILGQKSDSPTNLDTSLNDDQKVIYSYLLKEGKVTLDDLSKDLSFERAQIVQELTILELNGLLLKEGGSWIIKRMIH